MKLKMYKNKHNGSEVMTLTCQKGA